MRKRKRESELEEAHFEQNMVINNPDMYRAYMEKKKEEEENDGQPIVWSAPETIEEARELEKIFAEIESARKSEQNKEADDEFVKQVSLMNLLGGIDLDQIGDE